MSHLVHTETGRVSPVYSEHISPYRRARKDLALPSLVSAGRLYVLARASSDDPLIVEVNGEDALALSPGSKRTYRWYTGDLPDGLLYSGDNRLLLWSEGVWELAMELGTSNGSSLSIDGGTNFQAERMGSLHLAPGDYVIRIRIPEGEDKLPNPMVWEDVTHPGLSALRDRLPDTVREATDSWTLARRLAAWTAGLMPYRNAMRVAEYTPWHPETIIRWGSSGVGPGGRPPMAMCAHYGVLYVAACHSLGLPARCAVFTEEINGWNGHFGAEVWLDGRWVYIDPTYDVVVVGPRGPATVAAIQKMGSDITAAVEYGPGFRAQETSQDSMDWFRAAFLTGRCFRNRAVWPRTDFLTRPELTPPGHGSVPYCETLLTWDVNSRGDEFGMFDRFVPSSYFTTPPRWE